MEKLIQESTVPQNSSNKSSRNVVINTTNSSQTNNIYLNSEENSDNIEEPIFANLTLEQKIIRVNLNVK